jgi:hypothetical protein
MLLTDHIPSLPIPNCSDISLLPPSPFCWGDALFQKNWGIAIYPSDEQMLNIMLMANKLEQVMKLFPSSKIQITSWLRCPRYNVEIGGARLSAHLEGKAVDFTLDNIHPSAVRLRLKSELERINLRMEQLSDAALWTHLDCREPENGVRFFRP